MLCFILPRCVAIEHFVGEPETLTIVILRTITCIFYVVTSLVRILSVTSSCCNVMVKEILANVSSQQMEVSPRPE